MIDDNFQVYLIEVNTNPCFEYSSTLLARLIPNMIENAIKFLLYKNRIAVDPIYPPPENSKWSGGKSFNIDENLLENNKFELIFDELIDGMEI